MAVTPNLGLHQWQPGDSFLRTDFNSDFSRIDGAVPRMVSGTYAGDGGTSHKITLGFKPKFLLLIGSLGSSDGVAFLTQEYRNYTTATNSFSTDNYSSDLVWSEDGFILKGSGFMNKLNYPHAYFAIG